MEHLAYRPCGVVAGEIQLTSDGAVDLGMIARDNTRAVGKVLFTEDLILGIESADALPDASV